jgi:hypothetical protein
VLDLDLAGFDSVATFEDADVSLLATALAAGALAATGAGGATGGTVGFAAVAAA